VGRVPGFSKRWGGRIGGGWWFGGRGGAKKRKNKVGGTGVAVLPSARNCIEFHVLFGLFCVRVFRVLENSQKAGGPLEVDILGQIREGEVGPRSRARELGQLFASFVGVFVFSQKGYPFYRAGGGRDAAVRRTHQVFSNFFFFLPRGLFPFFFPKKGAGGAQTPVGKKLFSEFFFFLVFVYFFYSHRSPVGAALLGAARKHFSCLS